MRRVLRESVALIGFWMTLRYALIWLLSYKPFNDSSFDQRHHTDTDGMVPTRDLDIADPATKWQSNLYLGSPARVTRHLINSLAIDCKNYTFIDYGSGKGRALFVAAEFPFRRVVGVEISEQLHRVAEQNLRSFRGKQACEIELWCGNALDYPLPAGDLVLHMYHPFGPDVLRQMLSHIRASGAVESRRILLPYLFSIGVAKAVFHEFPELTRVRDELCVNNLYRWTLYELRQ
jgi:SAM-dependent methyltransferase